MKFVKHLIIYLFLIIIFPVPVFAVEQNTDIYKWIDEDGRVNYTAQPGNDDAQKMRVSGQIFKSKKNKKAEEAKAKNKEDEERIKYCKEYKDALAKYKKAPFLSRYDEKRKQNVRLTEEESKKILLDTQKDVSYWCNPPREEEEEEENDD